MFLLALIYCSRVSAGVQFIEHYLNERQPCYEIKIITDPNTVISNIHSDQIDSIYNFDKLFKLPVDLSTEISGRQTIIIPVNSYRGIILHFTVNHEDYSITPYVSLIKRIVLIRYLDKLTHQFLVKLFTPFLKNNNIDKSQIIHPDVSHSTMVLAKRGELIGDTERIIVYKRNVINQFLGAVGVNVQRAFTILFEILKTLGIFTIQFFRGIMALRKWDEVLSTQKLINRFHNGTVPIMIKGTHYMRPKFHNLVEQWKLNSYNSFTSKIGNFDTNLLQQHTVKSSWEQRNIASMTVEDLTIHHLKNTTAPAGAMDLLKDHATLLTKIGKRLFEVVTPELAQRLKNIKLNPGSSWYQTFVFSLLKSVYVLKDIALDILKKSSNIAFDIVEPIILFMQKLIVIKLPIPGLSHFFTKISNLPLTVMNLITLNTAMFTNWNIAIFTGNPTLITPRQVDLLTADPDPMRWFMNFHNSQGFSEEMDNTLNKLMDWLIRCQMMHFQYVSILYGDITEWIDQFTKNTPKWNQIGASIMYPFSSIDLIVFAMNYMYLVPYYPVDFVKNESEIEVKLANPDKYWFTWYLHWFIEVIAGQIQSMHQVFQFGTDLLSYAGFGIDYSGKYYKKAKWLIKAIIVGLPQLIVVMWISNDVWKACDVNDKDRLAITTVNTVAWGIDTASYLYMFVLFAKDGSFAILNGFSVDMVSTLIDASMLSAYHIRLGLMMKSGKYGLKD